MTSQGQAKLIHSLLSLPACVLGAEQNFHNSLILPHLIIISQTRFMFEQFLQQKLWYGGQMELW